MTFTKAIQIIVFQKRLVDYQYAMDKMQMYELNFMLDSLNYSERDMMEMMRFNSYITAQVNSKKKMKPKDIIAFPWDNEVDEQDKHISDDDISRLKNKAKQFINNGGFSNKDNIK